MPDERARLRAHRRPARGRRAGAGRSVDDADVVVLNTCCIRENADNKLYGNLGHLKRWKDAGAADGRERRSSSPAAWPRRTATSCAQKAPHVDVVLGTHNVHRSAELLDEARRSRARSPRSSTRPSRTTTPSSPRRCRPSAPDGYTAWVTIQIGCDNTCAFCIVPAVRGPEISRPFADVVAEVEALAADGVTEVTLLGQNVNSYGRDLTLAARQAGDAGASPAAVRRPAAGRRPPCPASAGSATRARTPRTSGPTPSRPWPTTPAVCEHLHLPLQAGSDRVLAAMHRGYTAERYLDRLAAARRAVADLAVSTDLIVGFPGETDDDFERTLEVVAAAEYDSAYTFIFSPRPGTEAADADRPVRRPGGLRRALRAAAGRGRAHPLWPGTGPASAASRRCWSRGRARRTPSVTTGRTRAEQARALPPRRSAAPRHLRHGRDHRRRARTTSSASCVEVMAEAAHRTRIPVVAG